MRNRLIAVSLALAILLPALAQAAFATAHVTITTTPTLIYTVADTHSFKVLVRNVAASASVYVGTSSVTTSTGFEIPAGAAASFVLAPGDSLYGTVASSTATVHSAVSAY